MDPPVISPHIQSSGIQNYSESQDPTSSVRRTIKKELEGKVLYDQKIVFDTLFTDKVKDQFVDSCLSAFKQSDEMQDAVRSLKALEGERKKGARHTGQRKRERDMYPHLVCPLGIEGLSFPVHHPKRSLGSFIQVYHNIRPSLGNHDSV